VVITSNRQPMASLGSNVGVEVFSGGEALAFLADRTSSTDTGGAAELATELGCLPLALAQATAAIVRQRLGYATYLDRLRTLPVGDYLDRPEGEAMPSCARSSRTTRITRRCALIVTNGSSSR
jgi:hypothetical protein